MNSWSCALGPEPIPNAGHPPDLQVHGMEAIAQSRNYGSVRTDSRQNRKLKSENGQDGGPGPQEIQTRVAGFVLTELDTAITFCLVALTTKNSSSRVRNTENALAGYRSALHFSKILNLELKTHPVFRQRVKHLNQLFHQLGQDGQFF